MVPREKQETGRTGEQLAAGFLESKGYEILGMNRKFGRAEIDIIARIGDEIVFVEVKARKTEYFGFPEESIGEKKLEMMRLAAEMYQQETGVWGEIRFDLVAVILEDDVPQITHVEDAFFPGYGQD